MYKRGAKLQRFFVLLAVVCPAVFLFQAGAFAGDVAVLDTVSNWRIFSVVKPPVVQEGADISAAKFNNRWLDSVSQPVAAGWNKQEFDDSGWLRGPLALAPYSALVERLYLRGKFTVTNPLVVGDLKLSAGYHGGIVVYLNGEEIGRANMAKAAILADNYPVEAFVTEKGDLLSLSRYAKPQPTEKDKERTKLWERTVEIKIPARALKNGVNTLGIEVVRAPYNKVSKNNAGAKRENSFPQEFSWATCRVTKLNLAATGASGLVPDTGRPQGLQVWNGDIMAGDYDLDYGSSSETLKAVNISGPRNGSFTGKIIIGSTKPIQGLSVKAEDLKGPAVIPSAAISIHYGLPWGKELMPLAGGKISTKLMGSLSDNPLKEYPLSNVNGNSQAGAVAPVWVTVKIPKDAEPGLYTGMLSVRIVSGKDLQVPVELKVLPWTLPEEQDYRTWVDLAESPDTLAVEYGLPLWSEKHFKMIGESFEIISGTGSRTVYIPAIAHTNHGNEESMIRWIKKPGNKYDWDFSVMEKYLDLAEKYLGKPKIVTLQVWEIYMRKAALGKNTRFDDFTRIGVPQVTFFDPVSKKTEPGKLPPLDDPGSKAVWRELIEQVQARLKKRGLEKALMLGMFCDCMPEKEDAQFFKDVAPKLAWVQQGHTIFKNLHDIAEVGYNSTVWGFAFGDGRAQTNQKLPPVCESLHGWNNPKLTAIFDRGLDLDENYTNKWYFFTESAITSELRGMGRMGADFWKAVKDKSGKRTQWVHERYREGDWGGSVILLLLGSSVLAPGKEGPESTNRLVAFMEGIEASEARIYIEKALMDNKDRLGPELAVKCQTVLDDRLFYMWRCLSNHELQGVWNATFWRSNNVLTGAGQRYFLSSEWQKQAEKLFLAAGEVEKKLGKK